MYCYNCMSRITNGSFCSACGKENTPSDILYHLKAGTLLDGKYMVGNASSEDDASITYVGRDMSSDTPVSVVEFFPSECVTRNREINGNSVMLINDEYKSAFLRGKEAFVNTAGKLTVSTEGSDVVAVLEENNTVYLIMDASVENSADVAVASVQNEQTESTVKVTPEAAPKTAPNTANKGGNSQKANAPKPSKKPKKKKSCLVVGLIALLISILGIVVVGVLVVAIIAVCIFLFNMPVKHKEVDMMETVPDSYVEVVTTSPTEAVAEFMMVSCEGMEVDFARSYLEGLGLQVSLEYEYSDKVLVDRVISQSVTSGNYIAKGETITLVVSKGVEMGPDGYSQKVVVTAKSGSSNGTLKLFNWKDGKWQEQFSCNATLGSQGISSTYGENSTATPKGTFKLGTVFTDDIIDTEMDVYYTSMYTCIVDDPKSDLYNTITDRDYLPDGTSYEPVGEIINSGDCNALIFIEHNGDGFTTEGVRKGYGSAITICGVNGTLGKTGGCIDITAENMTSLLALMNESLNPHIEITTN